MKNLYSIFAIFGPDDWHVSGVYLNKAPAQEEARKIFDENPDSEVELREWIMNDDGTPQTSKAIDFMPEGWADTDDEE